MNLKKAMQTHYYYSNMKDIVVKTHMGSINEMKKPVIAWDMIKEAEGNQRKNLQSMYRIS